MSKSVKNTIAGLRASHDRKVRIPLAIKAGIAALKASGEEFVYESPDFCRFAGISVNEVAEYRDQFTAFWGETPRIGGKSSGKKVWFPTEAARVACKDFIT